MIKHVMTHAPNRGAEERLPGYHEAIPNLIVNTDDFPEGCGGKMRSKAWCNYKRSWQLAGGHATVQYDDDIILCNNFHERLMSEIDKRPNDVIQFFSMRKDDLTIGSRYINGRRFMQQQCYYLPPGMAERILEYLPEFYDQAEGGQSPTDIMMGQLFSKMKLKYWNVVPNLVDHIVGVSAINSRRPKHRVSKTFQL